MVRMVFPLVVMMVLLLHCVDGCGRHCFRTADELELENNGYIGIIIGIDDKVQENSKLIDEIKDIFTDGSAELYKATRNRAYFRQITITVPSHWSDSVTSIRATTESYDRSHIIIDHTRIQGLANTPYVTGIPGCGQMGRYMHLTPNYILDPDVQDNYGPGGKTMVHEWGHLRYGVFDEYPTDGNNQHYFSTNGGVEAIRCSSAIQGRWSSGCNLRNGIPQRGRSEGCHFYDDRQDRGYSASIMYKQFLPNMIDFCDNARSASSSGGVHNVEAPSRQNRLCQQRSAWEVMRTNDDFRNNANLPRTIFSTKPGFRVVKRTTSNVVMVLSVGASMASADRIQKMGQAVRSFIMDDVQDGERVGMVTFNDKGNMMSDMVAMNDSMRDTMLPQIPTSDNVGGSSNLEAGVMKGIEVLERDGRNPSGGVVLLVTDGQENENDKMDEMMPMLKEKNVTVDFIAIGGNASKNLETIAESTNGMSFSYSEEYSSSNGLNEAFDTISQRGQNILALPVTVYSKALLVESKGSEEFTFNIDSTIGEGTQLTFDCLGGNDTAEVTVRKPDGGEIKKGSEGYQIDSRFHVVTIKIPGVAQVGRYHVTIYNPLSSPQTVMVTVKSGGKLQDDYPIIALAEWSQSKMTPPDQIVLHVAVTRGYSPVLNAMVQAKIERPGGVAMDITLLDNGAGADMAKDDGIYSMYFTSYTGAGRYTAKIFVVDDGDKTVVSLSKRTGYGAINVPNSENEDNIELPADESTGVFQRTANSGSLMCEGDECQMSPDTDMYSPSRITDLSVHGVLFEKKQVTLRFTAPGDDMDQGQASRYEIRMGVNFTDMMEDMSTMMMVSQEMVVQGDLSQPKPAGSTELITIQTVPEYDDAVLVFSMIAVDDSAKKSPQSNIVTAAFVDQATASSAAPSVNTVIMVATAILWLTM